MKMKYTYLLAALLVLGILARVAAPVVAQEEQSSIITAIPDKVPLNGVVEFKIENLVPATTDTVTRLYVEDPEGRVFDYTGVPFDVPYDSPVSKWYGPPYAGDWPKTSGPAGNDGRTSVKGKYHVVIWYYDQKRDDYFDASDWFTVPEFAVATSVITMLGFAGLMLARRRFMKP